MPLKISTTNIALPVNRSWGDYNWKDKSLGKFGPEGTTSLTFGSRSGATSSNPAVICSSHRHRSITDVGKVEEIAVWMVCCRRSKPVRIRSGRSARWRNSRRPYCACPAWGTGSPGVADIFRIPGARPPVQQQQCALDSPLYQLVLIPRVLSFIPRLRRPSTPSNQL